MKRSNLHASPRRTARYYEDLTDEYSVYGGEVGGWNYALWESDVRSHQEALIRGNEVLLRGLEVTPESQIVDLGCGCGGFAVWAARRFRCAMTGITVCRKHVTLARRRARENGVANRCRFLHMDMDRMRLGRRRFDAAVNQETYCYSRNKRKYLASIYELLAPGGVWSCSDFTLREGALRKSEEEELAKVLGGFHLPSLARPSETMAHLKRAGFVDCEAVELTPLVLPSAAIIMRRSFEPLALARAFPRKRLHSRNPVSEANIRGHYEAGMAYSVGLHTGLFHQVLYRARRPAV